MLNFSPRSEPLSWREAGQAALLLAALVLITNVTALIGGDLAPAADGPRLYYPFQHHAWTMWARGELPTWTNFVGGGFPLLASSQAVMFYPPNWLFAPFRTPTAYNLVTLLHLWIVGLGMYVLARRLAISPFGAAVAALAMIFGASMVARVSAGHIGELYNRAWTPWMLAAIHALAQRPTWRRAVALAVVFGLTLLAGSSGYQIVMYNGIVSALWGVYLLLREKRGERRALFAWWCAVAIVAGVGLSAAQTLPTLDLLGQGNRQGGLSDEDLNVAALPIPLALGYVLPHTFDDPHITDYIWPEYATYTGAGIIFLALVALRARRRDPLVWLWGGVALLFFLLSFGMQNPLFRLVLAIFPPYSLVRNPARHLAIVQVALAILAGIGWDALMIRARQAAPLPQPGGNLRLKLGGIALAVLILIAAATRTFDAPQSWDVFPQRLVRGAIWFGAALVAFRLSIQLLQAFPTRRAYALVFGVLLLDLVCYAHPLLDGSTPPGRLSYLTPDQFADNPRYLVAFDEDHGSEASLVLHAIDQGVPIYNLYSSILPERANAVANLLAGRPADYYLENHFEFVDVARPDLLDLSGVRWVMIEPDQAVFADDTLHAVRDEGVVRVYENTDALPLAYLVPTWTLVDGAEQSIQWLERPGVDYRTQAVIEGATPPHGECTFPPGWVAPDEVDRLDWQGGDVYLNVQAAGPRLLVIDQTYVEGWQGWVNGEAVTVYPANHRWLGVYLPCAGSYAVHLRYLPRSVESGVVISLAVGIGMLVLLVISGLDGWWKVRYSA